MDQSGKENIMSKVTVELNAETVDDIVLQELLATRSSLLEDYMRGTVGVFDFDPKEDRRQIGNVIKSIETVIDWYSVPGSITFDELPTFDDEVEEDA